jgi:hypothetical protein
MADETQTSTATQTSPAATTPPSDPAPASPDATVLGGGAQEAAQATTTADPATTDAADPAAPVVPEKYELTLEGLTLDPEMVTAADPVLRELGLSNEAANKLLPVAKQMVERTQNEIMRQLQDGMAAQKKEWLDAFAGDAEIGAARRQETEQLAAKALDALGYAQGHPFRTALNETGFGNHPDMIRAFRRMGELIGEDGSFARADVAPASKPAWERLYPNEVK